MLALKKLGNRFSICARSTVTDSLLGLREWQWSPDTHGYVLAGEYLCGWRDGVRAYYLKTGEFIEREHFSAARGVLTMYPEATRLATAA
ncbi:hypothetical protein ACFTXM_09635 [Streptomyces sp. NPDC056930]|uniref:hypothetical protein n=1 Tax=Streptomyces sp. NPDC056930 TaxID=3345967 RepID=UPI0036328DA8